MNSKIMELERKRATIARESLNRLRLTAPRVYNELMMKYDRPRYGLGAVDWGKVGTGLLDDLSSLYQFKEMSEAERKAAEQELRILQEKNASIERQLELQRKIVETQNQGLSIQQHAAEFGGSFLDQLKAKPWALPAIAGLVLMFVRGRKK